MKAIKTNAEYEAAISEIHDLMIKGEANLNDKELKKIRNMSLYVQAYERKIYPVEAPKTLAGMIELKMYEKKLNQEKLAKKLKISPAKFSLIVNGKQKPDVGFLKGIRKELDISADFILDHV